MRFARIVFALAGVWGLLTILPLFFLYDAIGRMSPPPFVHPEFYFGFLVVTLAWQIGFLIIARDPARLRPMMVAAILEKFGYVAALALLYALGRIPASAVLVVVPDLLFGLAFAAAYLRVPEPRPEPQSPPGTLA